jgi:prolyl-tRNA synthetase
LLVVGVPGDREVDLKRVEAAVYPTTVGSVRGGRLRGQPGLVRGYIGPQVLSSLGVRYLVDPRVVTGTGWLTGANEEGRHAINVVAGRDFTPDGTIEAAEVRPGDPCPKLRRRDADDASGHGDRSRLQLGRRFADTFSLDALGPDSKPIRITMGSYGIGVSRLVAAIAEQHHDEKGLRWPVAVAPVTVHIVAAGKGEQVAAAVKLGEALSASGRDVLVDDRPGVSVGVRLTDAELIGAPFVVVVGRRWARASSNCAVGPTVRRRMSALDEIDARLAARSGLDRANCEENLRPACESSSQMLDATWRLRSTRTSSAPGATSARRDSRPPSPRWT